ncbi:MAG: diaminobutyrate acetyltransferase [Methanobacteriales archaeon HGW-Methanobacteriales-1]|jgi:L-2,4-diaminobutyric acid acetyltransferase|nr:MAG: diaminobutyrate acetyltransferase [Methanobacteriales archaeon HGW-Methanobacteriales-1]
MGPENYENRSIKIRKPRLKDGNPIFQLVQICQPLDVNSLYNYLLICAHFDQTSAIAELNNELVGYVSAYIKPNQKETLFIWQVAVSPSIRGQGIATRMLNDILLRNNLKSIKFIETTVTPSNTASMSLFKKLTSQMDTNLKKIPFFPQDLFGESDHEEELLLQIGPIN